METATAYLLATLTGGNAPVSPLYYISNSTTLINSTTDAPVNNLAATVTAGTTYAISALVVYVATSSAGTPTFAVHAPAVSGAIWVTDFLASLAGTVSNGLVFNGALGGGGSGGSAGPAMTASGTYSYRASGMATFSATGTMSLQAHTSSSADTFTCQPMSFLSLTALQA